MIRSRVSEDGVLYLADGVEFISPREFYKRGDIRKIYFPSSIVEIGKEAFAHCENLEEIIFQNGSSCNFVYGMAFSMCKKLRGIDLPFSLTGIGFGGFFGCKSLKVIKGKRNLSFIGPRAFYGCDDLENVVFPNEDVEIKENSFGYCSNIAQFEIGGRIYKPLRNFFGPAFPVKYFHSQNGRETIVDSILFDGYDKEGGFRGERIFQCYGDSGFLGEGYSQEEALNDYIFLSSRQPLLEKLKQKQLTEDSLISFEEYRIISGSCLMGSKSVAKRMGIKDLSGTIKVKDLIEKLKIYAPNDGNVKRFLKFFEKDN